MPLHSLAQTATSSEEKQTVNTQLGVTSLQGLLRSSFPQVKRLTVSGLTAARSLEALWKLPSS